MLNGFGKRIKSSGNVYEGEFLNGEKDGVGVATHENGGKYEGKKNFHSDHFLTIFQGGWKDGNKHGWGRDLTSNSDKWEGEYVLGKRKDDLNLKTKIYREFRDDADGQRSKDRRERRDRMQQSNSLDKKKKRKKPPFVWPSELLNLMEKV